MKKVFLLFVFVCGLFANGKDSKSKNLGKAKNNPKLSSYASGKSSGVSPAAIATDANNIGHRQGGDTFASATVIDALPYSDSGTTSGYNSDYGPYDNGSSYNICQWHGYHGTNTGAGPDVVYSLSLPEETQVKISLCGSEYDTGLGVFNGSGVQVLGNDDACGLQSEVVCTLSEGLYYIVVDGYSTSSGNYVLNVSMEEDLFGPYSVGTITEDDGLRDGPDYCCGILYYPTDAVGQLPAIVYIPGYAGTISSNENWGPYLASHGIVTMFVNANIWWASNETRAAALLDGLVTFQDENQRPGSPLYGNINLDQLAVAGHSRGGGAALLAAAAEPSIKAVLALSPWLEDQFINPTTLDQDVPVLFLSGELDDTAPNNIHTNVFYEYTPETTDKLLFEISGGDHFTVKDPTNNSAMGLKALYWLEKYLRNDPTHCDLLIEEPTTASQFMTNVECGGGALPPVIASIDNQQISEDGSLTIGLSATSGTGLDLSFSVECSTPDVIVSLDNTILTATPVADWHGAANITILVTDENDLSDGTEFILTVTPVNDAPTIEEIDDVSMEEDGSIDIVLSSEDVDGDDLEYEITTGEPYFDFIIEGDTVMISPPLNWFGETTLTVSASDGQQNVDTDFFLTVTPVNDAPTIEEIDDVNMDEDSSINIVLNSEDVDGDDLTYSFHLDNYDVSLGIEEDTLTITATPDFNGDVPISIFVSDTEFSDSTSFVVTISAVNDPPEEFGLISPTILDTFQVNISTDETHPFTWESSFDVDSDVIYKLTVTLDYFGTVYTNEYEDITDTTTGISGYEYAVLMTNLSLPRWNVEYFIEASDEEFTIVSEEGEFVLENISLSVDGEPVPEAFALHQNYPNPFNPITSLRYDLPEDGLVNITIYDMIGRIVKTLVNSSQTAGYRSIRWNATNDRDEPVSAGLYLYTIQAGGFRQTKKMVLLK